MTIKILLFGPQGSGKSTQGKLLAQFLDLPYISTGDIFREISASSSTEGQRIRQILNEGRLVDDITTSKIVEERLKQPDCENGFILDGYPRTPDQIKNFDPDFNKVFYLKLSDEEATERLMQRGREDDTKDLIAERLKNYHEQTNPILVYYKNKGLLKEINGTGTIEQIQQELTKAVNE